MTTTRTIPIITKVLCACTVLLASGVIWGPASIANPPIEYTITSAAGANGQISPDGDTVVTKGSDLDLTATPGAGYQVDTWSVDGADAQTGGDSFTLTDIQADQAVDVTFKLLEFEVTGAAGGGGSIDPEGTTVVTYGSDLGFTATPDTGYKIDTWSVDGAEAQTGGDSLTLTDIQANHDVDVTFKLLEFEVTGAAGVNGAIDLEDATVVTYGSDLGFTATPDTGYQVDTWSVDGAEAQVGGDSFTLADIQADQSVDVTFRLLEFDISSSADTNGTIDPDGSTTVTYGSDLDFSADPGTGYQVDKWYVDGTKVQTGGKTFTLSDIQADHTVEVTFRLLEFNIKGIAGSNGAISPAGDNIVTYGSDLEFTAAPEGEYLVRIWSVDGRQVQIGGDTFRLVNIKQDHAVDVSFSLLYYIITPVAGAYGSIEPDYDVTAEPGDSLDFSATPEDEYEVRAWFAKGLIRQAGGSSFTLKDIQSDMRVEVVFMQKNYDFEATAGPGGSVSPRSIGVHSGGSHTFTATPDAGYEVDKWIVDGTVVQKGGTTYEVGLATVGQNIHVTFKKIFTDSLGIFEFEDAQETEAGIVDNNPDPDQPLVSVEPIGLGSDPDNSVLCLRNRTNAEGQMVNARAKGTFGKTDADQVLIRFNYLFGGSTGELVVYVSDSPLLLAPDDPLREQHYIEAARLPAPPSDLAGSGGSDRFGVFQKIVSTGDLDLTDGLYVELELVDQTDGGSICIDSWSAQVQPDGLDVNADGSVNEADLLKVLAASGLAAGGETARLDGAFSSDGYVDAYDVASWDWATSSDQRLPGCGGLPLAGEPSDAAVMSAASPGPGAQTAIASLPAGIGDILIAGKRGSADATDKLKDSLYLFDAAGEAIGTFEPASNRCNVRLVKGPDGRICQLNSETGLARLDGTNQVLVPPGRIELAGEPRNGGPATVYVGVQGQGSDSFGRPILDVALDADYVYVVPVVVDPDRGEPYTAAAKLRLSAGADSPYELVELYDDAPLPNDNRLRNNLREIELDGAGNVYVLNVNSLNESDILWRYNQDATVERLNLSRPDSAAYVPAPVAMHVSQADGSLYLASAVCNPSDPTSTVISRFATEGGLALEKSITIDGLHHVTGMTEDPTTGTLWIAGFNMDDVPQDPDPAQPAFYYPYLASVSRSNDSVQVIPLLAPALHDLALPMSILWAGSR